MALSYRSVWAEAVFLYPEWNRNTEQWHFHPPLSQTRLSCSLEEGLPSPVWINTFVRKREKREANEGVWRDDFSLRRETSVSGIWSEGWSTFSLLSFLILEFFYEVFSDWERCEEGTQRPCWSLGRQKRNSFIQTEPGDSSSSLQPDTVCLNVVRNCVWVYLWTLNKYADFICMCAVTCVPIYSCSFCMFVLKCKGNLEYTRRLSSFHLSLSSTLSLSTAWVDY